MAKNERGLRVKGLAGIAALLAQAPATASLEKSQVQVKIDQRAIVEKTLENLKCFVNGSAGEMPVVQAHNERVLKAAVREAYNLGHGDALDQNGMADALLEEKYGERMKLTIPVAVASIMEHVGLSTLVLDVNALSTVFERCNLDFVAHEIDEDNKRDWIEYTLTHKADDQPQPTEGKQE